MHCNQTQKTIKKKILFESTFLSCLIEEMLNSKCFLLADSVEMHSHTHIPHAHTLTKLRNLSLRFIFFSTFFCPMVVPLFFFLLVLYTGYVHESIWKRYTYHWDIEHPANLAIQSGNNYLGKHPNGLDFNFYCTLLVYFSTCAICCACAFCHIQQYGQQQRYTKNHVSSNSLHNCIMKFNTLKFFTSFLFRFSLKKMWE